MTELINTIFQDIIHWVPKIGAAAAVFFFFTLLTFIIQRIIKRVSEELNLPRSLSSLLRRTSRVLLLTLGFITAMGTLGVNVSALVAGLGLTGFALGFALKDTISNLLSGILILLYQPFEIGDEIQTSGYKGIVSSIDLRYTVLNFEGTKILIPNSKLFTEPVTVLIAQK